MGPGFRVFGFRVQGSGVHDFGFWGFQDLRLRVFRDSGRA